MKLGEWFPSVGGDRSKKPTEVPPVDHKVESTDSDLGQFYPERLGAGNELPLPEVTLLDIDANKLNESSTVFTPTHADEVIISTDGATTEVASEQDLPIAEVPGIQIEHIKKLAEAIAFHSHLLRANPKFGETEKGREIREEIRAGIELLMDRATAQSTSTKEKLGALIDLETQVTKEIPGFANSEFANVISEKIRTVSDQGNTESGFKEKGLNEDDLKLEKAITRMDKYGNALNQGVTPQELKVIESEARIILVQLDKGTIKPNSIDVATRFRLAYKKLDTILANNIDASKLGFRDVTLQGQENPTTANKPNQEAKPGPEPYVFKPGDPHIQ